MDMLHFCVTSWGLKSKKRASLLADFASQDSLLCVGLDPHKSELEEDSAEGAFRFCQRIIEDRAWVCMGGGGKKR